MSYPTDPVLRLLPNPQKRIVRKGLVTGRPLSSCERCKKRKIKCNTVRPQCERCLKAGADCVYQTGVENPMTRLPKRRSRGWLERPLQSDPPVVTSLDHGQQFTMALPESIDWVGQFHQENGFESNMTPPPQQAFIQSSSYQLPQSVQPFPVPPSNGPYIYPTTYDSGYPVLKDPLGWTSSLQVPAALSFSAAPMTFPLHSDTATGSTIDHSRSATPPIPWAPVDEFPSNPEPMSLGYGRLMTNHAHGRFKVPPVTIAPDRMDPKRDQSNDRMMVPAYVTRKVDGNQVEMATVALRSRGGGDWSKIALMCM